MLEIDSLVKTFDTGTKKAGNLNKLAAVDRVSFKVEKGQMYTLLGPSGCGKTTTLRSIAGLERPDAGEITVDGKVVYSSGRGIRVPAEKRGFGMVFQSYAIWPHMNVFKNVALPLHAMRRTKRLNRAAIRERVERVLTVVGLDHAITRQATDLSGGQQQRLALARALVMEPPLLLLDEPLSNLDAKLREEMRLELKRLQRELDITSLYVTHDQVEALAMSDRIAVMCDGQIMQEGRPREIYERPVNEFVASFIGSSNFISGVVVQVEGNGQVLVESGPGRLLCTSESALAAGASVTVAIRPEHVALEAAQPEQSARPGQWLGKVQTRAYLGESVDHVILVGDATIRARCLASTSIPSGDAVVITLGPETCRAFASTPTA